MRNEDRIVGNQLARRNLTESQKKELTARMYLAERKSEGAPKGSKNAAKNNVAKSAQLISQSPGRTRDVVAAKLGTTTSAVRNAVAFAEHVDAIEDEELTP